MPLSDEQPEGFMMSFALAYGLFLREIIQMVSLFFFKCKYFTKFINCLNKHAKGMVKSLVASMVVKSICLNCS